ncbi:hypothetical protein [Cellulosimicrobium arenosum]|uniref:Uncharacterized protein n=1 Tax=Cellulosimicrobium arenosum TaxID=2708133 RepID=A0A927G6H8_9MICO|nr:hypothetical protein [Cellulosimicrobium arenosum]MBD8077773.1 hypothetical protein [Cellulosimicrobium arenosum]
MSTLFGTVTVPDDAAAGVATVHVSVEDTTLQDVSSVRLAEVVLRGVDVVAGGHLAFAIDVDDVPADATVRVHVDRSGDGDLATGDLLTVRSVPAATLGTSAQDAGEVPVRTI